MLPLPSTPTLVRGKHGHGSMLESSKLGEPYLEVVLKPGDALYIPRGCLHATDTVGLKENSLHLTVGLEATHVNKYLVQGTSSAWHWPKTKHGAEPVATRYEHQGPHSGDVLKVNITIPPEIAISLAASVHS